MVEMSQALDLIDICYEQVGGNHRFAFNDVIFLSDYTFSRHVMVLSYKIIKSDNIFYYGGDWYPHNATSCLMLQLAPSWCIITAN